MILSLLRRFLYATLLLWVISIIAFWLSKQVPGDVVMDYLSIDDRGYHISIGPLEHRLLYERVAKQRGLDLSEFYFSISPGYQFDTVNRILPYDDRYAVKKWIRFSRNGKESLDLYRQLKEGMITSCSRTDRGLFQNYLCQFFHQSLTTGDLSTIHHNVTVINDSLQNEIAVNSELRNQLVEIQNRCQKLLTPTTSAFRADWWPVIKWHGTRNQYHQWMTSLISQRPLTSLTDGRNAWSKIYDALKWTILLNGFAFLMAMGLGIGIGIWSGSRDGKPFEKIVNWILFAVFALPSFWLGTLFIYFFSSGEWLSLLPAGGLGDYERGNFIERWSVLFIHLILPVTCLALGALAYVSRQMKQSVLHEYNQSYVQSLRAQGISEKTIIRKHVIRNALFPIITIVGGSIPALLSGSLIIEVIFSIPGMGRLMYNSLLARDWPVAFPVLMFGACITVFSYVLTDVIYKYADPRVKTI